MGHQCGFKDPRGNLFFQIARVTDVIKPKVLLIENVKNLIYHDNCKTFIAAFRDHERSGNAEIRYAFLL